MYRLINFVKSVVGNQPVIAYNGNMKSPNHYTVNVFQCLYVTAAVSYMVVTGVVEHELVTERGPLPPALGLPGAGILMVMTCISNYLPVSHLRF